MNKAQKKQEIDNLKAYAIQFYVDRYNLWEDEKAELIAISGLGSIDLELESWYSGERLEKAYKEKVFESFMKKMYTEVMSGHNLRSSNIHDASVYITNNFEETNRHKDMFMENPDKWNSSSAERMLNKLDKTTSELCEAQRVWSKVNRAIIAMKKDYEIFMKNLKLVEDDAEVNEINISISEIIETLELIKNKKIVSVKI